MKNAPKRGSDGGVTMATRTTSGRAGAPPPRSTAGPERTDADSCASPSARRAREVLDRVGDKWSVYVIHVLSDGRTMRFGELRRSIEGVSQRMLTVTLRGLEQDGLVRRTMYPEVPPRVEYALTPLGATLRDVVCGLVEWSAAHLDEVDAARARYNERERGWAGDA